MLQGPDRYERVQAQHRRQFLLPCWNYTADLHFFRWHLWNKILLSKSVHWSQKLHSEKLKIFFPFQLCLYVRHVRHKVHTTYYEIWHNDGVSIRIKRKPRFHIGAEKVIRVQRKENRSTGNTLFCSKFNAGIQNCEVMQTVYAQMGMVISQFKKLFFFCVAITLLTNVITKWFPACGFVGDR
jgi:hypothetical protein